MIDAEHDALRSLEEDLASALVLLVEHNRRIADHGAQALAQRQIFVIYGIEVARLHTQRREFEILLQQGVVQALGEVFGIEQIAHTDAHTAVLVGIGRTYAFLGRADRASPFELLVGSVQHSVVRHHARGAIRNV